MRQSRAFKPLAWLFVLAVLLLLRCTRASAAIDPGAFEGCESLSSVAIPEGITEIAEDAFEDSPELQLRGTEGSAAQAYALAHQLPFEVLRGKDVFFLPESLQMIGDEAFAGTAAQAVLLPESVTVLGDRVFAENARLQFVSIPESVAIAGAELFAGSDRVVILGAAQGPARDIAAANRRPFRAMDAVPRETRQRTAIQRSPRGDWPQEHALVPVPATHEKPTGRRACESKPARRQDRADMHFLDEYFP